MERDGYQLIVVGGGHAGVEAALAATRLNKTVLLLTANKANIASMPCNPSIGGPAKGIVVREIDALGGIMGLAADSTAVQFKMLNTAKGPGVRALRVQSDKVSYRKFILEVLEKQENLTIIEDMVTGLIVDNGRIKGVQSDKEEYYAEAVILTTGTYLNSAIMVSKQVTRSGPDGQATTQLLSQSLADNGIELLRLKTGTPARIVTSSIDFTKTTIQPGDEQFNSFSYSTKEILPLDKQLPCYLTYTNNKTHEIIRENLKLSSMYSGVVTGIGARHCPSIEDKIVRFSDKERHQVFLEPESSDFATTYVQGFSTSMPFDVQEKMIHSLAGLKKAKILKYAYAIEYDAIDPLQLAPSLEVMKIDNLFCAGQINGTSGYEEAAGQGLMAGINAVRKLNKENPVVLGRDEAYIGVMIDDIVTKGIMDPYRLLTSRAEYRLLLRHDNADERLSAIGHEVGSVTEERYHLYQEKMRNIDKAKHFLGSTRVRDYPVLADYIDGLVWSRKPDNATLLEILKRPEVDIKVLSGLLELPYDDEVLNSISIGCKYSGYIEKARRDAAKLRQMENLTIPTNLDYDSIDHLSLEAKMKLNRIKPLTLGQASRVSGVNPADIAVLALYIK